MLCDALISSNENPEGTLIMLQERFENIVYLEFQIKFMNCENIEKFCVRATINVEVP